MLTNLYIFLFTRCQNFPFIQKGFVLNLKKKKRLLVKQRGKFDIHLTKQEEFDIVYDVI